MIGVFCRYCVKNTVFCWLLLHLLFSPVFGTGFNDPVDLLSISELKELYRQSEVSSELEAKLHKLLNMPFVNNAVSRNEQPLSKSPQLGEFIRIAHWNIEHGIEYETLEAAFDSEERLIAMLDPKRFPYGSNVRRAVLEEARLLREADVIVLNEVDWGLKSSNYRNVVADLAERLRMNYAFGIEFIELYPIHAMQKNLISDLKSDEISKLLDIDADRYKGLHGIAILSRFPLENVRLIPFKHQPYDWFRDEKNGFSYVEKVKRKLVNKVFLEEFLRQVRRGGRTMLIADITDPRFPAGRATIVGTHLENRTSPGNRQIQLKELLGIIKPIHNPVVVAGDMNTSSTDAAPTSVRRELNKRFGKQEFWAKTGINFLLGLGMIDDLLITGITFGRNHDDPMARHIPVLMPNKERKFFSMLKEFRFADGGAFDFRGESPRSASGKGGNLSNSNERDKKGFVTTFQFERRVVFVGSYKLDWIFVKPANLSRPSDYRGSYVFAPHFGHTLDKVNYIAENRISDHHPMIVELPLSEPVIKSNKIKKNKKISW